MTLRVLHVLDHSIPLQGGYTFRTRAMLRDRGRRFVERERTWTRSVARYRAVFWRLAVEAL